MIVFDYHESLGIQMRSKIMNYFLSFVAGPGNEEIDE
jgi:hypothetical protein